MISGEENIAGTIVEYYKNMFTSSNSWNMEEVVQHIKLVVTGDMNTLLIGNFSKLEVELALKQMTPLKASGPYGMLPNFFSNIIGLALVIM